MPATSRSKASRTCAGIGHVALLPIDVISAVPGASVALSTPSGASHVFTNTHIDADHGHAAHVQTSVVAAMIDHVNAGYDACVCVSGSGADDWFLGRPALNGSCALMRCVHGLFAHGAPQPRSRVLGIRVCIQLVDAAGDVVDALPSLDPRRAASSGVLCTSPLHARAAILHALDTHPQLGQLVMTTPAHETEPLESCESSEAEVTGDTDALGALLQRVRRATLRPHAAPSHTGSPWTDVPARSSALVVELSRVASMHRGMSADEALPGKADVCLSTLLVYAAPSGAAVFGDDGNSCSCALCSSAVAHARLLRSIDAALLQRRAALLPASTRFHEHVLRRTVALTMRGALSVRITACCTAEHREAVAVRDNYASLHRALTVCSAMRAVCCPCPRGDAELRMPSASHAAGGPMQIRDVVCVALAAQPFAAWAGGAHSMLRHGTASTETPPDIHAQQVSHQRTRDPEPGQELHRHVAEIAHPSSDVRPPDAARSNPSPKLRDVESLLGPPPLSTSFAAAISHRGSSPELRIAPAVPASLVELRDKMAMLRTQLQAANFAPRHDNASSFQPYPLPSPVVSTLYAVGRRRDTARTNASTRSHQLRAQAAAWPRVLHRTAPDPQPAIRMPPTTHLELHDAHTGPVSSALPRLGQQHDVQPLPRPSSSESLLSMNVSSASSERSDDQPHNDHDTQHSVHNGKPVVQATTTDATVRVVTSPHSPLVRSSIDAPLPDGPSVAPADELPLSHSAFITPQHQLPSPGAASDTWSAGDRTEAVLSGSLALSAVTAPAPAPAASHDNVPTTPSRVAESDTVTMYEAQLRAREEEVADLRAKNVALQQALRDVQPKTVTRAEAVQPSARPPLAPRTPPRPIPVLPASRADSVTTETYQPAIDDDDAASTPTYPRRQQAPLMDALPALPASRVTTPPSPSSSTESRSTASHGRAVAAHLRDVLDSTSQAREYITITAADLAHASDMARSASPVAGSDPLLELVQTSRARAQQLRATLASLTSSPPASPPPSSPRGHELAQRGARLLARQVDAILSSPQRGPVQDAQARTLQAAMALLQDRASPR